MIGENDWASSWVEFEGPRSKFGWLKSLWAHRDQEVGGDDCCYDGVL